MEGKLIFGICGAIFFAIANYKSVGSGLGKVVDWSRGTSSGVDAAGKPKPPTRTQAFAAAETLADYYDLTKCPEGAKAAREVASFILHEHRGEPTAT